jgi:hypothetical protein
MGAFDPDRFMSQSFENANDTTVIPCPPGEYVGLTSDVAIKEITSKKTGISYPQLTVFVSLESPEVTSVTGRTPTKVRYQQLLDLNDAGEIDMSKGKNIGLGRLREACGLNQPGKPFRIPDLNGKLIKVRVTHRPDDNDPTIVYDEVKSVTKAG